MRRLVSVVLIMSMLITPFQPLASLAWATPSVSQALIEKVNRATALLYLQSQNGTLDFACTATAIEKTPAGYLFLTAAHCLGSDEGPFTAQASTVNLFITFDEHVMRFFPAVLVAVGYQNRGDDFALMHVATTEDWTTVSIGDEKLEQSGSTILNVSVPMGLGKQILTGSISAMELKRPISDNTQNINWRGAMLLQLPGTAGGASGSAVVGVNQESIIGIIVGTVSSRQGGATTIVLPVSRYKEFRSKVEQNSYRWYRRQ